MLFKKCTKIKITKIFSSFNFFVKEVSTSDFLRIVIEIYTTHTRDCYLILIRRSTKKVSTICFIETVSFKKNIVLSTHAELMYQSFSVLPVNDCQIDSLLIKGFDFIRREVRYLNLKLKYLKH